MTCVTFFLQSRDGPLRQLSENTLGQAVAKPTPGGRQRRSAAVGARYNLLAGLYDAVDLAEVLYKRRARALLFAGLEGRVLDAGVGTGWSIPFYPAGAEAVGMDLSPGMLQHAQTRGRRLGKAVDLVAMDLMNTGFPDASFDAVASAFTFCTLEESQQRPALSEMARILKPGGELRILDYALSRRPLVRLGMRAWQVWERAVFHGAFDRHTERYLEPAGFTLIREQSFAGDMVRLFIARRNA